MANECMLTTVDNPYDPFEQFSLWQMFDKQKGYDTCEYLARIAHFTDDMSQDEIDAETDRAIDEIIFFDPLNLYKKAFAPKEETQTDTE